MTTIGSLGSYSAYSTYRQLASSLASNSTSTSSSTKSTSSTSTSATNVTLSAAAKAALAAKSFSDVISEARTKLSDILKEADSDSPYKDGKLVVDLSGFDRRSLFAIASNTDDTFTADEKKAATNELTASFDAAMSGPAAVYEVTGDISKLYKAAQSWLDAASTEEKATDAWAARSDAVKEALAALQTSPTTWPDVENDPVVDYLKRAESGATGDTQDFSSVATSARKALDQQIADAKAEGKSLIFSKYQKSGVRADLSDFSSRSLSAIALNEGDQFSNEEIKAAKDEISSRGRQVLMSCIQSANGSSDITALSQNILSAYGSLSSEERQAVGWNDSFYQAAMTNYKSASYIASMFADTTSSSSVASLASMLS